MRHDTREENAYMEDGKDTSTSMEALAAAPEARGLNDITLLNILLRDALALRQRLFSYLQFYLTAQAGLAVLFGFVVHDAYDVLQMPSAKIVLLLSTLGLLASFLVIAYGLFTLRPGQNSREWISTQLGRTDHFGDVAKWAEACHRRLEWLLSANTILDKKVSWIRRGILIQLGCGFAVFLLSMRF